MGPPQPPSPFVRREALLRGPLILTALARVVMIPFYLFCSLGASLDLRIFRDHPLDYAAPYTVDLISLAIGMWSLLLLSVLLA